MWKDLIAVGSSNSRREKERKDNTSSRRGGEFGGKKEGRAKNWTCAQVYLTQGTERVGDSGRER